MERKKKLRTGKMEYGSYSRECNSFGSIFQEHGVKVLQFTCVPGGVKRNETSIY